MDTNELYKEYGQIIFPKGFCFYHRSKNIYDNNNKPINEIFCTLGYNNWNNTNLYKITLTSDTPLLFAVKKINQLWLISSLDDIYKKYIDNKTHYNDVDVKQEIDLRNKLINALRKLNITGWYTSIENRCWDEVCLFENYYYNIDIMSNNDYIDSLLLMNPILNIGNTVKLEYNNLYKYYSDKLNNIQDDEKEYEYISKNYNFVRMFIANYK